jgi:hypothetical protein
MFIYNKDKGNKYHIVKGNNTKCKLFNNKQIPNQEYTKTDKIPKDRRLCCICCSL